MTRPARPQLTLAVAGTVLGIGLGVVAAAIMPGLGAIIGALVAVIGATAVAAILLVTTWPASAGTAADDTAWTEFRRELRRARRSGRPLTLLRIPIPEPASSDVPGSATLVRAIGAELRLIDRTWVDGDSIYLMLPESSRSAATVVVDRLAAAPATVAVGAAHMATFPEDGLTSGALLAAVHGTAVGQVPIPLRPSHDEPSIRTVEADAALGGATGPR
jgi:hypothetical protein